MTRHTKKWREQEARTITTLASEYPVIAVADIQNFPASLAAQLRKKLGEQGTVVRVTKTRVAKRGIAAANKGLDNLLPHVTKSVALIFTKTNPFELYAFLKKNKGNLPAKAGMIADHDLVVPAGDTGLPPGPALSDLKGAGLKVKVDGATIAVLEDKVVTKKGEEITPVVAGTLGKLNIKPVKVGLTLTACSENQSVFLSSVLDIDTDTVFNNFVQARKRAFLLALETGYFTPETTRVLIGNAFRNAQSLALEANILTPSTIGKTLAKARANAVAIQALVKDDAQETATQPGAEKPGETAPTTSTDSEVKH